MANTNTEIVNSNEGLPITDFKKRTGKPLTVMVYMAADNNLSEESLWALLEINTDQSEAVDWVAFFDSNTGKVESKIYSFGSGKKTTEIDRRKYAKLEANGNKFSIKVGDESQGVVARTVELKTGSDIRVLEGFLSKILADETHQAENYILVLSGHSTGALGNFLPGDRPNSSITIPDLSQLLKNLSESLLEGKPLGILGMDSCLMSMVEIGYELRDSVRFLIAAEGFEPVTGWPYQRIRSRLNELVSKATKTLDPKTLSSAIAEEHTIYYSDYAVVGVSIDQSVCDLSALPDLVSEISGLADQLIAKISDRKIQDAVLLAHWRAQSYHSEEYTDLWDFCDLLQDGCNDQAIKDCCQKVKTEIEKVVVYHNYYGPAFQHSHGLSIFFPWKETYIDFEFKKTDVDLYSSTPFGEESGWGLFLSRYLDATQREMRGQDRNKKVTAETEASGEVESILVIPTPSPLVIPVRSDPPGSPRSDPPGSPRSDPPGSPRGLSLLRMNMKNPPRGFLVRKTTKEPVGIKDIEESATLS